MAKLVVSDENGTPVELYFEDHGKGDPVVLIHGWPLSSRMWEAQVPALADAGHRVITYDRRGFGWSCQPWEGYDYATLAADLHALLEHRDVRDATLVGFSMGGGEVARYIATYGTDRVAKVVLAAAATPNLYKTDGGVDDALVAHARDSLKADRLAFLEGFFRSWFAADAARPRQRGAAQLRAPDRCVRLPERHAGLHRRDRKDRLPGRSREDHRADPRHPRRLRPGRAVEDHRQADA
jgi:non-heme chloroperoxidase